MTTIERERERVKGGEVEREREREMLFHLCSKTYISQVNVNKWTWKDNRRIFQKKVR